MARSIEFARLFVSFEANTKGLTGEMDKAERSLDRVASFITKNPLAAIGALGASMVALGVQATRMAGEVDSAMRQVANAVPGATERLEDLKAVGRDLSTEFGISQVEIARVMEQVARTGVDSADTLIAATKAAVRAQRATGEEFSGIVNLIDSALDVFGVSANDLDATLARLLATAKGRVSLTELAGTFERLAPIARSTGVDIETLTAAVVTLRDRGETSRGAISRLNETLRDTGAQGIKELADRSRVATDGVNEMQAAIDTANASLDIQSRILKERLNAQLIDLGSRLLPPAIRLLEHLNQLISVFDGTVRGIERGSTVTTITNLSNVLSRLPADRKAEEFKRLLKEMQSLSGGAVGVINPLAAVEFNLTKTTKTAGATRDELFALRNGLEAAAKSGQASAGEMEIIARALSEVNARLVQLKAFDDAPPGPGTQDRIARIKELVAQGNDLQGVIDQLGSLTEVERTVATESIAAHNKRSAAAKKATEEEAKALQERANAYNQALREIREAAVDTSVTLIDDLGLALEDLEQKLLDAGVSAEDVAKRLRPLQTELRLVATTEKFKLPELLKKSADALTSFDVGRLRQARTELRGLLAEAENGSKQQADIRERIAEVSERITEAENEALLKTQANVFESQEWRDWTEKTYESVKKIPPPLEKSSDVIARIVPKVVSVAQGALGAAQAFGLVSDETAVVLQNIVAAADNVGKLAASGFTDPTAWIGAVGSLAGVISSLFGESPETRARKRLLEQNTDALRKLTDVQGDLLRINQPGARLGAAETALAGVFSATSGKLSEVLGRELAKVNLSLKDLEEIADSFGIQLRNPESGKLDREALRLLLEVLKTVDVNFENTFQGELDRIQTLIQAGILKPSQELAALLDLLTRGDFANAAIADALKGVDVFADPEAGIEALQDLIRKFDAGELTKEDLGGLTGQEFLNAILDLINFLKDDQEDERLNPRDPFTDRGIDQPEGQEIGDLPDWEPLTVSAEAALGFYDESLSIGEQQLAALEQLVSNTAPKLVAAPSVPTGGGGFGGGLVIENISVSLSALPGEPTEDVARRAGELVAATAAQQTIEQIDQQLATVTTQRKLRFTGGIVLNAT